MAMTIPEALEWWRRHLGHSIILPTPPACAHLMNLAQASNIPVGTLSIVSRPLEPGCAGTHDRATGDLCCSYEAALGEAGQREVLQTLLMLIAGVKCGFPIPRTIGEEWEQIQKAIEEAYTLARQWGQETVFTEKDLSHHLTQSVHLEMRHHAAGELAGHRTPTIARQAYVAASALRGLCVSDEEFAQALAGTSPQEPLNDALVDFDRSPLRDRWLVTSTRRSEEPASFGDLALPVFPRSARVLRSALKSAASQAGANSPRDGTNCSPRVYRQVCDEADLAALLHLINTWLIDLYPNAALRLHGIAYGDAYSMTVGAARLYRLSLSYEDLPGHRDNTPIRREVWALFTDRRTLERRAVEGAWQRFLVSWLKWSEVQCEELAVGLQTLWGALEHPSGS